MSWNEKGLETMREEFVKRVLSHEKSKSKLCREYGISRPTGDKWIKRYLQSETMEDRSRAPLHVSNKTPKEIEEFIVEYRRNYPVIGATKIHRMLQNEGYENVPCQRTINDIFKRNGLITKEASQSATPYKRFQKETPNEMWQADFKGNFLLGNGSRCFPLNIIDDCTRYNLCCRPLAGETYAEVMPHIVELFKEYGMPRTFLCDNGNPWGTSQSTGFTKFEVSFMELGILVLHGRMLHPQTQGKEESFNKSMKRELLSITHIEDWEDAALKFAEYRNFYNNKRPHFSLGLDTPVQHYRSSDRKFPDRIIDWEYSSEYIVRKVKRSGYITIGGQGYFLSEAFGGKNIAVKTSEKSDSLFNLYFRQFRIGQIDVNKRVFTYKKIYLINDDPRFSDNLKV